MMVFSPTTKLTAVNNTNKSNNSHTGRVHLFIHSSLLLLLLVLSSSSSSSPSLLLLPSSPFLFANAQTVAPSTASTNTIHNQARMGYVECNNCYDRGKLTTNSSIYCECACQVLKSNVSGAFIQSQYLVPDCRYTTTQTTSIRIAIDKPLKEFYFSTLQSAIFGNLTMSPANSQLYLTKIENTSDTQIHVTVQIRDDGPPVREGFQNDKLYLQYFRQALADTTPWIIAEKITAVDEFVQQVAPIYTEHYLGHIEGFAIPTEATIGFSVLVVVIFILYAVEIVCSDNFIVDDQQGEELLERAAVRRLNKKRELDDDVPLPPFQPEGQSDDVVMPLPQQPSMEEQLEDDSWLKDAGTPDYTDPDPEPNLKRKGTRSLKQYAQSFYQNA